MGDEGRSIVLEYSEGWQWGITKWRLRDYKAVVKVLMRV